MFLDEHLRERILRQGRRGILLVLGQKRGGKVADNLTKDETVSPLQRKVQVFLLFSKKNQFVYVVQV